MDMNNMFNGMFGKVAPGLCRLSMAGKIAVKTSTGYKSYDKKTGRLTNCDNFVFNIGEEFFFVIPTNKVDIGDIILVNSAPKCVIKTDKKTITVINYENSIVETILPERHFFMGEHYFYGKIISMFGQNLMDGKKGTNKIMSYMMLNEMMKGTNSNTYNSSMNFLPMLAMFKGNDFTNIFSDIFDFDLNEDDESNESTSEIEE